jgi:preprotein translocase subunit SecB
MATDDKPEDTAAGTTPMAAGDQAASPAAAEQPKTPSLKVLGQFIRDLSFENVSAQKGQQMDGQPDIAVKVGLDARRREGGENRFEVAVKLAVTATAKEGGAQEAGAAIFAMEIDYAGIFQVSDVPENQMHPYLLIECPRMLFPFLRRIVSDVTRDGGFPPLNLENIDWVNLYRQQITRRAQEEAAKAPSN